ncbi:hypothetical protein PIB30_066462, partial [Stylosanthes scabra]|nr:hypothetical protein [Stylosanthes scabra]
MEMIRSMADLGTEPGSLISTAYNSVTTERSNGGHKCEMSIAIFFIQARMRSSSILEIAPAA